MRAKSTRQCPWEASHWTRPPPPPLLQCLILRSKLNILHIWLLTENICHSCLKTSKLALVPPLTAWFLPVSQTLCLRPGSQFGLHQFLAV